MPRKAKNLNDLDLRPADDSPVATMPPPPEGAVERVTAEDEDRIHEEILVGEAVANGDIPILDERAAEPTPEHTYDVAEDGSVRNVQAVDAPKPSTNGKPRHFQIRLLHGPGFVPDRCKFCGGKCPPHPARLLIRRPLGDVSINVCAKCDEVFTEFFKLLGEGEVALEIVGPDGSRQTDMLDELESAVPDGDEDDDVDLDDVDGPPTAEVAEHIREIAKNLPDSPYDQGAAAFCEGLPLDANPYIGPASEQESREQWDDGWRRAQADQAQAATQALADAFGAEVTIRGLDHDGTELGRVEASAEVGADA